jgi:hypothetical protein
MARLGSFEAAKARNRWDQNQDHRDDKGDKKEDPESSSDRYPKAGTNSQAQKAD